MERTAVLFHKNPMVVTKKEISILQSIVAELGLCLYFCFCECVMMNLVGAYIVNKELISLKCPRGVDAVAPTTPHIALPLVTRSLSICTHLRGRNRCLLSEWYMATVCLFLTLFYLLSMTPPDTVVFPWIVYYIPNATLVYSSCARPKVSMLSSIFCHSNFNVFIWGTMQVFGQIQQNLKKNHVAHIVNICGVGWWKAYN